MLLQSIIVLHVACGAVAFVTSILAVISKKGHTLHRRSGTAFTIAMAGIFITALGISIAEFNLWLVLIAIFSVYLAVSGWLIAKNRQSQATTYQWGIAGIALVAAAGMVAIGTIRLLSEDSFGTVLIAFGLIMAAFATEELWRYSKKTMTGATRIAAHLSRMLGGTIAIFTAATVVNLDWQPQWLLWLLPMLMFLPLIVYWNITTLRQ